MDNLNNIWISLAPGLVILALMLLALAVFVIRQPEFEQAASRKSGSVLLPTTLIRYAYWLADSIIKPLGRVGVKPNHVTVFSIALTATAAVLVVYGNLMIAAWVLFGAMACDLVDGLLARSLDMQTTTGAFFDSFCDRLAEGILFVGLAYLGRDGLLLGASLWAFVASYLVSYARGRGEALGVDCKAGLMQRPERLLVLFFTLLVAPLVALGVADVTQEMVVLAGVGLVAVLSTVTALQRASLIMSELGERDADDSSSRDSTSPSNPKNPENPKNPQQETMAEAPS